MRSFSVSEELFPIDSVDLRPAPLKSEMTLRYESVVGAWTDSARSGQTSTTLSVGLVGERIQVTGPPESTLFELLENIRIGRALADRAAREQKRRAVALGSPVFIMVPDPRVKTDGYVAGSTSTHGEFDAPICGLRIHIAVESPEEGVQVLDRVRLWLPVLLALSANSPFWQEHPTQSSSYRYYSRSRSPFPRLSDLFGSAEEYERRMRHLTHAAAARFSAITELDAQLSATRETLDVLLTDVCMNASHAAVLGAVTRALVEVMSRQWREGIPPVPAPLADVHDSSWLAAMNGLRGLLISPTSGRLRPAADVVMELLAVVAPALRDFGEAEYVNSVIEDVLRHGNGSRQQREAYSVRHDLRDVVKVALEGTHDPTHDYGIPGAILAETWALTDVERAPLPTSMG